MIPRLPCIALACVLAWPASVLLADYAMPELPPIPAIPAPQPINTVPLGSSGAKAGICYDSHLTLADGMGKWREGLDPRLLYGADPPLRHITTFATSCGQSDPASADLPASNVGRLWPPLIETALCLQDATPDGSLRFRPGPIKVRGKIGGVSGRIPFVRLSSPPLRARPSFPNFYHAHPVLPN